MNVIQAPTEAVQSTLTQAQWLRETYKLGNKITPEIARQVLLEWDQNRSSGIFYNTFVHAEHLVKAALNSGIRKDIIFSFLQKGLSYWSMIFQAGDWLPDDFDHGKLLVQYGVLEKVGEVTAVGKSTATGVLYEPKEFDLAYFLRTETAKISAGGTYESSVEQRYTLGVNEGDYTDSIKLETQAKLVAFDVRVKSYRMVSAGLASPNYLLLEIAPADYEGLPPEMKSLANSGQKKNNIIAVDIDTPQSLEIQQILHSLFPNSRSAGDITDRTVGAFISNTFQYRHTAPTRIEERSEPPFFEGFGSPQVLRLEGQLKSMGEKGRYIDEKTPDSVTISRILPVDNVT